MSSVTASPDHDLLVFDVPGVTRLRDALVVASTDLAIDQAGLVPPLLEASFLLGVDRIQSLDPLGPVRSAVTGMAVDVAHRLDLVGSALANARAIDELSVRLSSWGGTESQAERDELRADRADLVLAFVGGDQSLADSVIRRIDGGSTVRDAVDEVVRRAEESRIETVMDSLGVDRETAIEHVGRLDSKMARLLEADLDQQAAIAALSIIEGLDLDLDGIVARAESENAPIVDVLGHTAIAQALGLSHEDAVGLEVLRENFESFDSARAGTADGRVSITDLELVASEPDRFAPAQVTAAQAILASPELLGRLDIAAVNEDILSPGGFGSGNVGDGLISIHDLEAFVVKAHLGHVLGDYADQIDVAADPGGDVDGFVSRDDLETFISDTPDLPADVRAAAETMLDAGWFDRTWLEEHRDELAMGMAVVAGAGAAGLIIASGGTATPLALSTAGAVAGTTAAAGTTLAVNASGDANDPLDDVLGNGAKGALLGVTVAELPIGFEAIAAAPTLPARVAATAGVVSDAATVTSVGGIDLVLPESIEEEVHDVAELVFELTGPSGERPNQVL